MSDTSTTGWHRTLPDGTRADIMDILAKALLIRIGDTVVITAQEILDAAATQAEYGYRDGKLLFRVERQ